MFKSQNVHFLQACRSSAGMGKNVFKMTNSKPHWLLPLSSFIHVRQILQCPPDRVLMQGMGVVHHLAEVDNEVGLTQSQYCYARMAHLTPMSPNPKPHIGHQKCDSGSLHCPRYSGELASHLCWAWLAGCWEHVQGLLQ